MVPHLIDDMQRRWAQGERPTCEAYFRLIGDQALQGSDAVELMHCEFLLRQRYGLPASREAFCNRFPQFAAVFTQKLRPEVPSNRASGMTPKPPTGEVSSHPLLKDKVLPAQIGRYTVISPLDSGGQADVFLGVHPTLHQNVVIKVGRHGMAHRQAEAEALLREGRLLANLNHENLVRVFDVDVIEGYPIVVMQHVSAPSLDQYVRGRTLADKDIAQLVSELAHAVDYIHQKNLLHLDIKPKNVLVDEDGRPRLIDFGLARLIDAWTQQSNSNDVSGTLQFMSPEQAIGDRDAIGRPSDIFALGGILYFMMTQRPPYVAETVEQIMPLVRFARWNGKALKDAPHDARLKQLCRSALQFDPRWRCPSAGEFARRAEACLLPVSRRRTAIVVTTVIALTCLILAVFLRPPWASVPGASDGPTPGSSHPRLLASAWSNDHLEPLHERLPLVNGDELHLQATVPRGQEAVLLHHDLDNGWTVLEEWPNSDERREIHYPARDQNLPLTGRPGPQLLLLCCAPTTSSLVAALKKHGSTVMTVTAISPYAVIQVDSSGVRTEHGGRGFGVPVDRPIPETRLEDAMRAMSLEAEKAGGHVVGVAFQKE